MNEKENELENVGALWKRKAKSGSDYMSLVINNEKYLVFPNKNKKENKHPDFTVHIKK